MTMALPTRQDYTHGRSYVSNDASITDYPLPHFNDMDTMEFDVFGSSGGDAINVQRQPFGQDSWQ